MVGVTDAAKWVETDRLSYRKVQKYRTRVVADTDAAKWVRNDKLSC